MKKNLAEKCSLPDNFSKHIDHIWLSAKKIDIHKQVQLQWTPDI